MKFIHPSHRNEADLALRIVTAGLLVMLAVVFWPQQWLNQSFAQYLPLHILLETLAIVVALHIFALVWGTRKESLPCNLSIIAISMLASGILDFSHMLSYDGMPDFVTPASPEKAINFWLAARLISALGLLAIAFHSWQVPLSMRRSRLLLYTMLLLVSMLHALFLLSPESLPRTFVPGEGLTALKIASEYALIGLLLLAAARFALYLRRPRQFNATGFLAATLLLAQGEFFLTLYAEVSDHYNLAGHLYKIAGFIFLYRAVYVEALKRPYKLLHQSRARLTATLNALPDLLFEMDAQGRYLQAFNASSLPALPRDPVLLLGRTVHEVLPAEAATTIIQALHEAQLKGISRGKVIELIMPDSSIAWFEVSIARSNQYSTDKNSRFLVLSRDVSDRHRAIQELNALSHAIDQNPLSILLLDKELRIQRVNQAFTRLSGYSIDEVKGLNPHFLQSEDNPRGLAQEIEQQIRNGASWTGKSHCRRKDGRHYTVFMRVFPSHNGSGEISSYLIIKEDITERTEFAARLEQLSHHDALTGLANRKLLQQKFASLLAQSKTIFVFWLDLDNFKEVNDALGHSIGDMLLQQVSYRLRDQLGKLDILARLSGDDFVVVLPNCSQADAVLRLRSLLDSIREPFVLPGQTLSISASAGVAAYPADGDNLATLLQKAELGKYKAKAAGRNNYQFYEQQMQENSALRLAQSNALKTAIAQHELFLVYQPQVCLRSRQVTGFEALLRWQSQPWGLVPPMDFIPLAEASGLILPISEWVLTTALRQLRSWLDAGIPPLSMAVNISAIQFEQPGFVDQVETLLKKNGLPPELLDLELTEAVAMKNPERSERLIQQLHALGVRLSIDDFGTGYSSLSYLKRFKIDKLKIDREFIREMEHNHDDQTITTTVIQMAQQLSITALAEGVENVAQLDLLLQFGCEQVQGYYYSPPLPAEKIPTFLQRHAIGQNLA